MSLVSDYPADTPLILVVDDEPFFHLFLKKQLKDEPYHLEFAADGQEGLEKTLALGPDLIISDWKMPLMDGIELCRSIRQREETQHIHFIMVTSNGEMEHRVEGLEAGADDYLEKPWEKTELLARIKSGLRVVRLQRKNRMLEQQATLARVAATLAHEINNPLMGLTGNLELLKMELARNDCSQLQNRLRAIEVCCDRVNQVVERMIQLKHVEPTPYVNHIEMLNLFCE